MALLLASLVLLPMFWLALTSLRDDSGRFTLEHYRQLVVDPAFLKPLANTLWTSCAVGALCVIAAAPMSWLVSRTDLPGKRLLRVLILASFVTPPFLGAFAWVLLGGPNAGLLNQWYYGLFGLKPFEAAPLLNIFSASGMVFVIFLYTFPYVFTFVANSLDLIPSELEEASAILGASPFRTALHITLPLGLPALVAGFLVAFLQSMTLFGPPAILAMPAGIDVITTKIWSLFQFPPRLGLAAAASLPLLPITVALLRAQTLILRRRGYAVISGKSGGRQLIRLGDRRDDPGHRGGLPQSAQDCLGPPIAGVSRQRAGGDSRDRARGGTLPELHPAAACALRHVVDHLLRLPHQGASGGLSADLGFAEGGPSRARGCEPHFRRHPFARAL